MTVNSHKLPVSLNEFRFYAMRAIVGYGLKHGINLDYGMADSLVHASIYGAAIGFDPADLLANALQNIDALADSKIKGQDNPFTQAINIADRLLMGHDISKPISTDSPLLIGCMIGHSLLQQPHPTDHNIALQWKKHCVMIGKGMVWLSDNIMRDKNERVDLQITKKPMPTDATDGQVNVTQNMPALYQKGMEISRQSWVILYDFYHYILVPSTDESRLAGAGAGLVDND